MVNIGFTGTQNGVTRLQLSTLWKIMNAARSIGIEHLHHGDCIGADRDAHLLWTGLGGKTVGHPPLDPKKRAWCICDVMLPERPYMDRNEDIVLSTQILIAAPDGKTERTRSGTWATVRRARVHHKPICIIFPGGSYITEGKWTLTPHP
jgi:hypothetical protein